VSRINLKGENMSEKKVTIKEALLDYTRNIFRPKAPISFEMYRMHKMILLPLMLVILVSWIVYSWNNEIYNDSFYKLTEAEQHQVELWDSFKMSMSFHSFLTLTILVMIPSELRMFHKRKKNPVPYIAVSAFVIIGGIIYIIFSFKWY